MEPKMLEKSNIAHNCHTTVYLDYANMKVNIC